MFRSWKLCLVLSVSLLSNLWIGAQAQDDDFPDGLAGAGAGVMDDAEETYEEQVEDDDEEGTPESVWVDEHFSADQLLQLHAKIDADGDKKISLAELMAFSKLTRKKLISEDTTAGFAEMDINSDGKISLDELLGHHPDTIEGVEPPAQTPEEKAEDDAFKALETAKFKAADGNKDGSLTVDEAAGMFYPEAHSGILDVVAAANLKTKDKNGDGELEPDELWDTENEEANEEQPSEDTVEVRKTDFEKLDLDKNGKINFEEFKHFESGHFYTDDAMKHLIETADADGDGLLTATELARAKEGLANHPAVPHMLEWIEHHEL